MNESRYRVEFPKGKPFLVPKLPSLVIGRRSEKEGDFLVVVIGKNELLTPPFSRLSRDGWRNTATD